MEQKPQPIDNLDRLTDADLASALRDQAFDNRLRMFRDGKRLQYDGWSLLELERDAIECERFADKLERAAKWTRLNKRWS